jgi:ribosomal protein S12 methylthiotransferase accessory factor
LEDLLAVGDSAVDVMQIASELISPETGIIREVSWYEKDVAEPHLPYVCQVTLANHHFRTDLPAEDLTSGGKGLTHDQALASGLGEAIERYAADWVDPSAIVYARRAELDGPSMDPVDLVLYAPEQYATVPYHPYEETSILGWVRGRSLVTGESVYIPALAVFLGYQAQRPEEHLFLVTSNGVAAGGSLVRAILTGTYEVIERDALMLTWFASLPTRRVDPLTHPDSSVRAMCRAYQRRGVEIGLWRLPTDQPCAVFLALGLQQESRSGPSVIAGLGADLAPAAAARKAILEVGQIRPSYRRSLHQPDVRERMEALVKNPQSVATMHEHGLLYCSPDMRHALGFLLDQEPGLQEWSPVTAGDAATQLEQLVDHFRTTRGDLLYYNLTPPDLARLGLAAARVVIPGFQPVTFGAEEPRLGGARLYELPQLLGLALAPLTREDLNPYPHPFD